MSRVVGALIIGVVGFVLAALFLDPVARAAMPGSNGKIVFESDRAGSKDIFVMNADGSNVVRLTDNDSSDSAARWSPDGSQIVFSSNRGGVDQVYVMDADGSNQAQLTSDDGSSGSPAWSPDGARIVFTSNRHGNQEIYVMNADGSGVTRLTSNAAIDNEPVWSPDGTKICFYSDRDGDFEIFIVNPDGSDVTQLTFNSSINDVQPDWSPDGSKVVFARGPFGGLELEIWTMNADGSGQVRLTDDPAIDNVPSFSPDGRRILFSSDRDGDAEIFVMNADGSEQTQLTSNSASDFLADWQPQRLGGLVMWLRAEGDAQDSAGNHHGTLENGTTFAAGRFGEAFSFDGIDDRVVVPHRAELNGGTGITIDAWVNAASAGHGRPIAQMRSSGNVGGYTFETTHPPYGPANGLQWVIWINGAQRFLQTPDGVLGNGTWHHVAATFDGSTMRIFVDGTQRASAAATGAIDTLMTDEVRSPVIIGSNVVIPGFAWEGLIDEIEIYNRGLGAVEIAELFNRVPGSASGTSTTLETSPNPSTLSQPVILTAVVAPAAATGAVTFYDGLTVLGTRQVSAGEATLTTTLLPSGVRSLTALYVGDAAHDSSVSAPVAQTVQAVSQNSFHAPIDYRTGSRPHAVAVGDFNGDGRADVVTANGGGGVSVLLGTGTGTFLSRVTYASGPGASNSVVVGDFNQDGRSDLAVANSAGLSMLIGNGDGTFQPFNEYPAGDAPSSLAVGDFNGDGRADLVVGNSDSDNVSILLGNGNGTFLARVNYPAGNGPSSVAVGDFNQDGSTDVVVGNLLSETLNVLLGEGDGTFASAIPIAAPLQSHSVTVADFNRDGAADVVSAGFDHGTLSLFVGSGQGTFNPVVTYATGSFLSTSVVAADFDGDGRLDLAVANPSQQTNSVSVLLGRPGTFLAPVQYAAGAGPYALAAGDFNGDGGTDLVVANENSADISILLGRLTIATSTTLARSPNPSILGQAVTLTATVTPGTLTGLVTFYDGTTILGIRPVTAGQATLTTTLLPAGVRSLSARYAGDPFHDPSVSAAVVQTVQATPQSSFQIAVNYRTGTTPHAVAVGDFNGDGRADVVVGNSGSDNVSILLGNGNGTFLPRVDYPAGDGPAAVAIGDFNGDGKADLAVANRTSDTVTLHLGVGNGTFQAAVPYDTGNEPSAVAIADLNGDGWPDLAVARDHGVIVFVGRGDGTIEAIAAYGAGNGPSSIAAADFNGDGRVDLAVGDLLSETVSVLAGNGDGSFQDAVSWPVRLQVYAIAVGDFNADGKADLAAAGSDSGSLSVLIGLGTGNFGPAILYPTGSFLSTGVAVGDFNGDGRSDLAVANSSPQTVSVLLGVPGAFLAPVQYVAGNGPYALAAGDFNGDGGTDLVVTNEDSNNISILLGTTASPTVITVATSPAGLEVTVDGIDYTAPQAFSWLPGSAHVLGVFSQGTGTGTTFGFVDWSDGGDNIHTVTAPSSTTVYTAHFTTQHQLTTAVSPSGAGTITVAPSSGNHYYLAGTTVQLTAVANAGFVFTGWSGSLTGPGNPRPLRIDAPHAVTANFEPQLAALAGTIVSKSGPAIARVWTVSLTNNGQFIAFNAGLTGFTLTQTFGPRCTPTVTSPAAFPLAMGNIQPGGSASAAITIDFAGCAVTNRFSVDIRFSAGRTTGSIVRFNQFQ